jgi:VanZ family protein
VSDAAAEPHRLRLLAWLLLYAAGVVYSSLVLGPVGFHYVPQDPIAAWHAFLHTPYVENGSDQRPDWIANLLNQIPTGFLIAGVLWPYRWRWLRPFAVLVSLVLGIGFVLAVKYAQLFFPPRTVTLNYITAQSIGVTAGVFLLCWWRGALAGFVARQFAGGNGLAIVLGAYTIALIGFSLVPFDIALSVDDWHERLAGLPALFLSMPAADRPTSIRILLVVMSTASTVPIGMLLGLLSPRGSLLRHAFVGLVLMTLVAAAEAAELSATPYLVAIGYRTFGILAGAVLLRGLRARDPARLRALLARLVPALALPYIAAVLFVSGVLTRSWRTVPQAMAALEWRGLVPFWHWYIVTKEHAAQSLVVHLAMYAPIGVMIWLRRGRTRGGAWLAAVLAMPFALAMEVGRWFKPELQPDFNDVLVAGVAALGAYLAMPRVWRLVEEAIWPAPGPAVEAAPVGRRVTVIGVFVSAACAALAAAAVMRYPLGPVWPAAGLLAYAAVLWRWPAAWLVAVPFALPCLDFSPWTGWLLVGESDLVVLVTVAVLLLRDPPARGEWWPRGFPGAVLALATVVTLGGIGLGLASPVHEPGGTSSIYLSPWNALRVAKGFGVALVLLPFLLRQVAAGRGAWLGGGMIAGLLGVAAAGVVERLAFTGLWNFATEYRVLGPFASEHIGGGHIGAYLAMALPFVAVLFIRPRVTGVLLAPIALAAGAYALVVTSSRTGYAVGALGMAVVALLLPLASLRSPGARRVAAFLPVPLLLALAGVVFAAATQAQFMTSRFKTVVPDLDLRVSNWEAGLAARDPGWRDALFGMGIGTYPRVAAARETGRAVPSNFVVGDEGGKKYLSVLARSRDYFGQKVNLPADGDLHLTLAIRPHGAPTTAVANLCAKWLLYSVDCISIALAAPVADQWNQATADFAGSALTELRRAQPVPRPIDLSFDFNRGQAVDFAGVSFRGADGGELIANGGFTDGTARWMFTDDDDTAWRIMNFYLLLFFEGGAVGLAAMLLLVTVAGLRAFGAVLHGERLGVPVVASLLAFLAAGAMDGLAESPRLMAVLFSVVLLGLTLRPASSTS